jgi:hypothetical protein
LERAAVGAMEGQTGRDRVPLGCDVLHREPKVGERLYEGGGELPLGLQALQVQRAWVEEIEEALQARKGNDKWGA